VRRFFIAPETVQGDEIIISGDLHAHMVRVLRLGSGDLVCLATADGRQFKAEIVEAGSDRATARILKASVVTPPAAPPVIIYQAFPKGDKLELVIEKGTELGAHAFVLFPAERSVARPPADRLGAKLERWQRIAREASRQCGRPHIPDLVALPSLEEALKRAARQEVRFILWEAAPHNTLRQALSAPPPASIALLVGPEGGFSPAEATIALEQGFTEVSLGPRILRTETAGLAALAVLQHVWGDLG
jgi:16S rRNA (uracil1498-N3)-methyltransferase